MLEKYFTYMPKDNTACCINQNNTFYLGFSSSLSRSWACLFYLVELSQWLADISGMLSAIVTSNYVGSRGVQKALDLCNLKTLIYKTDFSINDNYEFLYHDGVFVHIVEPTEKHLNFCLHLKNSYPGKPIFLLLETKNLKILNEFNEKLKIPIFASPFAFRSIACKYNDSLVFELDRPYRYEKCGKSFVLNSSKRELCLERGKGIRLINKEFFIMKFLFTHKGQVVSKVDLFEFVWGKNLLTSTATIDVHMCKLRSKLKKNLKVDLIKTVHGAGYMLE